MGSDREVSRRVHTWLWITASPAVAHVIKEIDHHVPLDVSGVAAQQEEGEEAEHVASGSETEQAPAAKPSSKPSKPDETEEDTQTQAKARKEKKTKKDKEKEKKEERKRDRSPSPPPHRVLLDELCALAHYLFKRKHWMDTHATEGGMSVEEVSESLRMVPCELPGFVCLVGWVGSD